MSTQTIDSARRAAILLSDPRIAAVPVVESGADHALHSPVPAS